MADSRMEVELVATADQYESTMKKSGDTAKVTGQQIADALGGAGKSADVAGQQLGLFAGAEKGVADGAGQLQLFARSAHDAAGGAAEVPAAILPVKPAAEGSAHGTNVLVQSIRAMRSEGRMAGFIGRQVAEIGVMSKEAAKGVGLLALGMAGAALPLVALEAGIMALAGLREKFKEIHEAEEEARKKGREFGVEIVQAGIDATFSWQRFKDRLEDIHKPDAVKQANEEIARLRNEAEKAAASMAATTRELQRLYAVKPETGSSKAMQELPVAELGGVTPAQLAEQAAPPSVNAGTFGTYLAGNSRLDEAGRKAAVDYVNSFSDEAQRDALAVGFAFAEYLAFTPGVTKAGKAAGEEWLTAFKKAAAATSKAVEIGKGTGTATEDEMKAKALEHDRQIHVEQMKYAGDELRLRTELNDKLAALEADKEKWGAKYEGMRAATKAAGDNAILAAQQKHEEEVRSLRLRYAEVVASDRLKIELKGAEEVRKLQDQQALKKSDPAEVARLQRLIDLQKAITREQTAQYDLAQKNAAADAARAAALRMVQLVGPERSKVQAEGQDDITKREEKLAELRARQTEVTKIRGAPDADLARQIENAEALLESARRYNTAKLSLFDIEERLKALREDTDASAKIEEVDASDRRRTELQGLRDEQRIQDELTLAKDKYARLPGDPNAAAEIARLERRLDLQQQLNAAVLAKVDRETRATVGEMREVGFDADKQRQLSAARSQEQGELQLAKRARDVPGLLQPGEFDAWTADIARRSKAAATLARMPWITDFVTPLKGLFTDLINQLIQGTVDLGAAVKALGAQIASSLLNRGIDKLVTGALGAGAEGARGAAGVAGAVGAAGSAAGAVGAAGNAVGAVSGAVNAVGAAGEAAGAVGAAGTAAAEAALTAATTALTAAVTADTTATTAAAATTTASDTAVVTALGTVDVSVATLDATLATVDVSLAAVDIAIAALVTAVTANTVAVWANVASGFFLPFAEGGRPPVGVPSLGGEQGPELFIADSGKTAVIGKHGPELFKPPEAGVVLPADVTRRYLTGGAGAVAAGRWQVPTLSGRGASFTPPNLSFAGMAGDARRGVDQRVTANAQAAAAAAPPAPAPVQVNVGPNLDGADVERVLFRNEQALVRTIQRLQRLGRL